LNRSEEVGHLISTQICKALSFRSFRDHQHIYIYGRDVLHVNDALNIVKFSPSDGSGIHEGDDEPYSLKFKTYDPEQSV
jgi:hypothetical protein